MKDLPATTLDLSPVSIVQTLRPARTDFEPLPIVTPTSPVQPVPAGIEVSWARHLDEVREAQRLRYTVFAGEMGAVLPKGLPGHDVDLFDDFCEHLLVRDSQTRQVVGTYRVLTPAQAKRVGSTYSDTEFDLTRLRHVRERMVELGRSCVHRDHRHGGVIMALVGGLGRFHGAQPARHHDRLRHHSHATRRPARHGGRRPRGGQHLAPAQGQPPRAHRLPCAPTPALAH
jgi:hypothetical protein